MNGQALLDILREVFQRFGYEVRDASYRFDLEMVRDGDHLLVKCGDWIDFDSMKTFVDAVRERRGRGLYISTGGGFSDGARRVADDFGVMLWDREDLELQIGKAMLAEAEGRRVDPPFKRGEEATLFWPQEPSLEPVFMNMEPQPQYDAPFFEPRVEETPMRSLNICAVPLRLGRDEAISIGLRELSDVNIALLNLIPLWRYSYSLSTERKYKSKVINLTGEGEGAFNALTGEPIDFAWGEVIDNLHAPADADIRPPSVSQDEARRFALQRIIEAHTREVQFDAHAGEAIITESRVFKPNEPDIRLTMELVHVPVWEIKGSRHSIEIDGYDGSILDTPITDDAEFV